VKSDPPEARTGIAPPESLLQRATRELREQAEQIDAENAREQARLGAEIQAPRRAAYTPRTVQLVLYLFYDPAGTLVRVKGAVGGRPVLNVPDPNGVDLGAAAQRTLELGALGALLGS
jgi:hypothetical protein